MSYTERFSEVHELLAVIDPAAYTSEQNSGYVSLAKFHRAVIIINAGVITGNIDVDIEEGTNTSGGSAQSFDSASKDITLTATTDNNTVSVIEIRTEELDIADGFDCINLEMTSTNAIFGATVWGVCPRYAAVSTTNLDSVTD
jgi:hypothetical protein